MKHEINLMQEGIVIMSNPTDTEMLDFMLQCFPNLASVFRELNRESLCLFMLNKPLEKYNSEIKVNEGNKS
jgi:hypothetical protein